jgi:hypothetical protein
MRCLMMAKRRCKTQGCKAELTDPSKGYCSRHIYRMALLVDTTEWLRNKYEIERLAKQNEADVEHKTDI